MSPGGRVATLALAASLAAPVESLDWKLQRRVQAGRSPALDGVADTIMDLTKPQVVFGGLLLVAAFGGPAGPAIARHALFALIPVNAVVEVTKRTVDRHRPEGTHKRSNASFPSSHAANAAALAWVLGWHWRRAAPLVGLFALAVAAARVYLNRHFASDVLVGVLLGLASGWLVTRAISRRASRARHRAA